jgi:signal transduction histidine kinase
MSMRRDLHDQVGSSLAGMSMQLELARRLTGTDSAAAHLVLAELHSDMTELIMRVRQIVANRDTADTPCNVEVALRSMIGRMNRVVADRLEISLRLDPEVNSIRNDIGKAAFWIVREAVINVLKHSTGQHCSASLLVRENELHVRVEDDGVGTPSKPGSGGFGLVNMSERAAERGGWCTAGPMYPRGFAVVACFPLAIAKTR